MKFYIILYLTIAFMFSNTIPYTPYMTEGGVSYTDVSGVEQSIQAQAKQLQSSNIDSFSFVGVVKEQLSNLIKTVVAMTFFQFKLPGAPAEVQNVVSGFFGILSVLFYIAVLREVKNLVPWV